VIMPNYNHGHYLIETLDSILGQSLKPAEVIVIDDASTDNSIEIIESVINRDPTVRLLRNESNTGPLVAVNSGLKQATSEYVYAIAADDRILPTFFEESVDLLEQYPQAGLCSSDMGCMDNHGNTTGEYRAGVVDQASFLSPPEILSALYQDPAYIIGGTTIYRRSALEEAGWFPPQLLNLADWFTERAIAFKHGACYLPKVLFVWRLAESQYSATCNKDPWKMLDVVDRAVELMESPRYREIFPPEFVEFWCHRFGGQVIDEALANLTQRQYAFMEQIGRCVESSGVLNRLLRRSLWTVSRAALSFSRSSLKRRLRPIQKKSGARLNKKSI